MPFLALIPRPSVSSDRFVRPGRQRFKVLAFCSAVLIAQVGFAQDTSTKINLVFRGNGSVSESRTAVVNTWDRKENSRNTGVVTTTGRKQFTGSGYIEIAGNMARIKLPSAMVPPLNGGENGWFPIRDFFMNEREITGRLRLNFLNKPKLHIDRNTGIITLESGFADFSGECELIKEDNSQRKF